MSSDDNGDVDTASSPEQVDELRVRAVRGVGWVGAGAAIVTLMMVVRIPILARLLDPADYGRMVWVSVFVVIALPVCSLGVWPSMIRARSLSRPAESSLFWLTAGAGMAFCGIFVGIWGVLAALGTSRPSLDLLAFCSLTLIFDTAIGFLRTRHSRNLRYHVLFWADVLMALTATVATIACAKCGMGAWSLAIGLLTGSVVNFLVCGPFSSGIPAIGFHWQEVRKHLVFGRAVLVTNTVSAASRRLHYLAAGGIVSEIGLGYFSMAERWTVLVSGTLAPRSVGVAYSAISRLDTTKQDAACKYLTVAKGFLLMATPFFLISAVGAKFLVPLVFSHKWEPMIPLLQLLCISGFIRTFIALQKAAFLTLRYPSYQLVFEAVSVVSGVLFVWVGAVVGRDLGGDVSAYTGAVTGFTAAQFVQFPVFAWRLRRCGGYGMGVMLKAIKSVLISGVLAGAAGLGCVYLLPMLVSNAHPFLALSLVALVISGVFLGVMALIDMDCLRNWTLLLIAALPIHRLLRFARNVDERSGR